MLQYADIVEGTDILDIDFLDSYLFIFIAIYPLAINTILDLGLLKDILIYNTTNKSFSLSKYI